MVLVALGAWTYRAVEDSLRGLRAATMSSLLDAQANALRVWIREEIGDAERIAREPLVRAAIARLAASAEAPGAGTGFCAGPARDAVEDALRPLLRDEGDATFNVTAPDGRLIATRFPQYCGRRLTAGRFLPLLAPVFRGEARFIPPWPDRERIESPEALRQGPAFGWIVAPVRDERGRIVAALGIAEPADGVLSDIVGAARPGATGDLFAFDEQGRRLTRGRAGASVFSPPGLRIAEGAGLSLEGYRDQTGAEVVGAWRWLPDAGLGVAIEMSVEEAYAPLRYLRIAFGTVLCALAAAIGASLWSALSLARLRGEFGGQRRIGPYRLDRVIGEGGMADVYLARHDLLRRPCALKILKPARATDEMVARFEREVQIASALSHPNVVEIYDYGRSRDGLLYYAMEYLEGENLAQMLAREGALPVPRALRILRQLCAGLAAAHAAGIVHRDVKPENLMVLRRGEERDVVKILDFGMVKRVDAAHSRDLTRGLRILGTPQYMAPERLRNPSEADVRSDIYAVGAVAFWLLSGRKPFEGADDLALSSRILNDVPPRVSTVAPHAIPVELDLLVQACLEKDPSHRPQRAADLVEALDALA